MPSCLAHSSPVLLDLMEGPELSHLAVSTEETPQVRLALETTSISLNLCSKRLPKNTLERLFVSVEMTVLTARGLFWDLPLREIIGKSVREAVESQWLAYR